MREHLTFYKFAVNRSNGRLGGYVLAKRESQAELLISAWCLRTRYFQPHAQDITLEELDNIWYESEQELRASSEFQWRLTREDASTENPLEIHKRALLIALSDPTLGPYDVVGVTSVPASF